MKKKNQKKKEETHQSKLATPNSNESNESDESDDELFE